MQQRTGPQSSGFGLFSDYFGDDVCYSRNAHYQSDISCITTIADAIRQMNKGGETTNATGVPVLTSNASGIPAALAKAHRSRLHHELCHHTDDVTRCTPKGQGTPLAFK
jgi:hypothetical protein